MIEKILNLKLVKNIIAFFDKTCKDHIGEYTAQCAYYAFLSFMPFIILLLSLIKYVNIEKDTLVYIFEAVLPNIMKNSVMDVIQEVYSKSIEIVSISAIFMLWSASNGFYALNKGLSAIYKKQEDGNYILLRIKGVIGAIIALVMLIFILILLVFGNSLEAAVNEKFKGLSGIIEFILKGRRIIAITAMFFIFLAVYKISSGKKQRGIKEYIIGAAFTSIAWYLISFFFSIYVDVFTNFSIIYGSLATVILIMMWVYTIIYAILLGAEINVVTQEHIKKWFQKRKFNKMWEKKRKND